jgi:hypothetical protein
LVFSRCAPHHFSLRRYRKKSDVDLVARDIGTILRSNACDVS